MVIAFLFGATVQVSVFRVAQTLVQTLYDFLVGGMVSAALVPVFSDYTSRENRAELWRIASIVINFLALGLAFAILLLEVFAPQIVSLLGSGYCAPFQAEAVEMIRFILPAIFFLGMSGVVTGLLYSLKRFTYPAFTTAAFNLSIILVAVALAPTFGITSLILGIVIGAALQLAFQFPGLRDANYQLLISLRHPIVKKILGLYAPVAAGLTISTIGVFVDRNLACHANGQALAWMQNATVLIQFPLGLVGTAISFAILPELSRQSARFQSQQLLRNLQTPTLQRASDPSIQQPNIAAAEFQSTLAFGIKLVLLLILPAAVGLFVLARPIIALLFEHGAFTSLDTSQTALALQFYLIGLPFAAIDQPLVFAFYARKNTLLPNLVAFAAVGVYLLVAFALIETIGMVGLVIANSAQLTSHALMMLWFTRTRQGGFGREHLQVFIFKTMAATAGMGLIAYLVLGAVQTYAVGAVSVIVPAMVASMAYVLLLKLLRVHEADQAWEIIANRLTLRRRMV